MPHIFKDKSYSILLDNPNSITPDKIVLSNNEHVNLDKPTIISLGGNMTNSDERAMGMNSLIKHILGIPHFNTGNFGNRDNINIYSVNYGIVDISDQFSETQLTTEEIIDLTRRIFEDQIFLNDSALFSFEEIKANFGNLHFFTHCYGSYVLTQIIDYVIELLVDLKFDKNQITELLSQITAVNYAPITTPKLITNINIMSMDDDMIDYEEYLKNDEPLNIAQELNNVNIVSQKIINDKMAMKYYTDHNIQAMKRDDYWQSIIRHTNQDMKSFDIYPGGNAECISEIVAHILGEQLAICIRENNEEKLTPSELTQLAQSIAKYYTEEQLSKPIIRT